MKEKIWVLGILFLVISCKTTKRTEFIDDHIMSSQDLESKGLFFYSTNSIFYSTDPGSDNYSHRIFINGYYTNVKPSSSDRNIPTSIFGKNYGYFHEVLQNRYLMYYTYQKKLKMRIAYIENGRKEKLGTLNDVYDYLKSKKIPYHIVREKKDIYGNSYADILLTRNSLYCKVKITKKESVSNIYYNIKDTLSSIRYGNLPFFYSKR